MEFKVQDVLRYQKSLLTAQFCEQLTIADKRYIFSVMRDKLKKTNTDDIADLHLCYLPKYGFTLGEFCLYHTIADHIKKSAG